MIRSIFRYNISILEYFQFEFYGKSENEKRQWAGTGFMYEYQKLMNPISQRRILDDKTLFHRVYHNYFRHQVFDLSEMKDNLNKTKKLFIENKIVLKESKGKCGLGTFFVNSSDFNPSSLIAYMEKEGFDLAETFIQQHPDLMRLSPSGVNTVRIFTQLNKSGDVEIIGCRQRISVNSNVDNLAAGNIAAPIDEKTGIISGPGVYSDFTKSPVNIHPVTKTSIIGFQIPYWEDCLQLVKKAAIEHPENRSIGWDVIVTSKGVGLLEGNHDWCKLVWQLPVKKGLKPILDKHMNEYTKNEYIS